MPDPIRRITKRFMNNPQEVKIKVNNDNAPDIEQTVGMFKVSVKMRHYYVS